MLQFHVFKFADCGTAPIWLDFQAYGLISLYYVREPYSMGRISQTDILTVGLLPQEQRQPLGEVAVASTGARLI